MNRVTDCQNQCQRPNGFICTRNCKIAEEIEEINSVDKLLWQAMEALAQLRPSQPVLNDIEKYFGVENK